MPIIIKSAFFEENKHIITQKGMMNILTHKKDLGGEDYHTLVKYPVHRQQVFDLSEMVVSFKNIKIDNLGNITADIIKYGVLREFTDDRISFVLRAFQDNVGRIVVVAIDAKYE